MQSNCGSLATWILLPPPGIDALSTSLVPSKPHPNYSSVYDSTPGQLTIQKFPLTLYHSKLDTEVVPSTVPGGCPPLAYRLYPVRTLSRVGCIYVSDARIGRTPRCVAEDMPYLFLFDTCPDNFRLPGISSGPHPLFDDFTTISVLCRRQPCHESQAYPLQSTVPRVHILARLWLLR